ncbi:DUF5994 family protein [Phytomonospora endophytica]|uniref:Uncharacterized protein n=1 Tax=Phytomonospora endophytica TaxID=714109 RepID=A0A841FU77_9ACTN|nr:DUF5994 family protein [Phytomonospora endophytica]MBB6036897.1 hypothetical protein [Phytomonospora endophytica]GIG68070.1 hypothetical protein Pen01_43650 [Phytomonospora endophytica]
MPTETSDNRSGAAVRAARLAIHRTGADPSTVDGGWWPRSPDAAEELPGLVRALEPRFGTVGSVTLNRAKWIGRPRRVTVGGRTVPLEWTVTLDPALAVVAVERGRLEILVVPPSCDRAVAEQVLGDVWRGTSLPPAEILACC